MALFFLLKVANMQRMKFHKDEHERLRDRDRRAASEEWEIIYLKQKFGVSESDIKLARASSGNSGDAIVSYLEKQRRS